MFKKLNVVDDVVLKRRGYTSYEELHDENPELNEDDVYSSEVVLALEDLLKYHLEVGKCDYRILFERLEGEEGNQDNCAYIFALNNKRTGKQLRIYCGLNGDGIEDDGYSISAVCYERNSLDVPVRETEFICNDECLAEYIDKILEYRNDCAQYISSDECKDESLVVNFLESAIHKTMSRNIPL